MIESPPSEINNPETPSTTPETPSTTDQPEEIIVEELAVQDSTSTNP